MNVLKRLYGRPGRVARPASVRTNIRKTLTQILRMWLVFLLAGPALLYHLETRLGWARFRLKSPSWRGVGVALFLLGWAVAGTSAIFIIIRGRGTPWPLEAPRQFVIAGPYLYVRNPMALGSISQGVAVGLFLRSPLVLIYALLGALTWHFGARPWEERDLVQRFGPAYTHYRAHVRLWLPRRTRYVPPVR